MKPFHIRSNSFSNEAQRICGVTAHYGKQANDTATNFISAKDPYLRHFSGVNSSGGNEVLEGKSEVP